MIDPAELHELIRSRGLRVAAAESLTGGDVTARLVSVPGSGEWLRGGVVAYDPEVKFSVLGVTRGPVVTDRCATEMARGVARLLHADVGLATTGVAGPESLEGRPVGTVIIGLDVEGTRTTVEHHFDGDPEAIRGRTVDAAVALLVAGLRRCPATASRRPG
jgi:nicotinamide-nucleotide amidase